MRKYDRRAEETIRMERLVREWARSDLLDKVQEERMLSELKVDLRRTNLFFRLILFAFGLLIILSAVLLAGVALSLNDEEPAAILCLLGAAGSFALSNGLIARFRLYRFGIEEAAAVAGGVFLAFAAGIVASLTEATPIEFAFFVGLVTGAIAGLSIYARYGYLYAAFAGMLCLGLAPSQLAIPDTAQHFMSAVSFLALFIVFGRLKRNEDHFPADDYAVIQAVAWLGIYVSLNLYLSTFDSPFRSPAAPEAGLFYWFTYAAIWLIPIAGLLLALRERARAFLDVNIGLFLITLATNKPYLGITRQTWDPILLGIFLIGTAILLRRLLSARDHDGFAAERILLSDKRGISALATASAVLQTAPQMPSDQVPVRNLEPGGGRSGGAGASGEF
jgi:hypothetical protein